MSAKVHIDWSLVVLRFTAAFDKVYCASKKAHFDCLPPAYKVVDGTRIKWCNLLLLDAIIYFCNAEDFNFISRRAFNQQHELFDAIVGSMKTVKLNGLNEACVSVNDIDIVLEPAVTFPWDNIDSLKFCMTQSPPCKSKYKYLTSVDLLCAHPTLTGASMSEVLLRVVKSALKAVHKYQQQHLLQTTRTTFKLPEDKLASFKYLPPSVDVAHHSTLPQPTGVPVSRAKRTLSEDSYTDYHPPLKRPAATAPAPVAALVTACDNQGSLYPQMFDQVFQDLSSAFTTTMTSDTLRVSGYISSTTNSTSSGGSSISGLWMQSSSVHSDFTTSSISDGSSSGSHQLLGNISFDSMESIESLNEAINLLNGY